MRLPDKVYNVLKWLCLIALPAIATLYSTIAEIWGLPYQDQIPETITAVSLFIGIIIGISAISGGKDIRLYEDDE